jgi:hypothetical protein
MQRLHACLQLPQKSDVIHALTINTTWLCCEHVVQVAPDAESLSSEITTTATLQKLQQSDVLRSVSAPELQSALQTALERGAQWEQTAFTLANSADTTLVSANVTLLCLSITSCQVVHAAMFVVAPSALHRGRITLNNVQHVRAVLL